MPARSPHCSEDHGMRGIVTQTYRASIVHGAITDLPYVGQSQGRVPGTQGRTGRYPQLKQTSDWRVRWNALLASTPTSRLMVVEGTETFNITNKVEVTAQRGGAPDLRRRWIDLSGRYE